MANSQAAFWGQENAVKKKGSCQLDVEEEAWEVQNKGIKGMKQKID